MEWNSCVAKRARLARGCRPAAARPCVTSCTPCHQATDGDAHARPQLSTATPPPCALAHARPGKQSKRPSASAMASAAAAQAPLAPPPAQPDWLTLPLELLQRCLSHLEDERAAFSSCRRFGRAVLLNSLQQERPARVRWDVDRAEPFEPSARLVQALVGDQDSKGLALRGGVAWTSQAATLNRPSRHEQKRTPNETRWCSSVMRRAVLSGAWPSCGRLAWR